MPKKRAQETRKKRCTRCGEEKLLGAFYGSKSPVFALDGKVNICKTCCDEMVSDENGIVDQEKFKNLMRQLDKPYFKDIWQSSQEQYLHEHSYVLPSEVKYHGIHIFHLYMKNINSLRQFSSKSYDYSEKNAFYNKIENLVINEKDKLGIIDEQPVKRKRGRPRKNEEDVYTKRLSRNDKNQKKFKVTDEIITLFGDGFTEYEYKKMSEKYERLKMNYIIQTNLHQEALATYVRFKVKEEDATARGDVDEAKKWYMAAQDAADKAKLSPKQLSESDLQKGLNSFSEISQALEQAVDIIEILPRYKNSPADSVDFTIWCYINYARKLKGLPLVNYNEVYGFYDEMKKEYLSQYGDPYGIFEHDPTENNRVNVEKFITIPKDYGIEDAGGDDS